LGDHEASISGKRAAGSSKVFIVVLVCGGNSILYRAAEHAQDCIISYSRVLGP
jgi:hypothetical protein